MAQASAKPQDTGLSSKDWGTAAHPALAALRWLDRWLVRLTEAAAAALLTLEVVVLSAGVASRYVFGRPLLWTDEVASTAFLWLTMLGAVIALRRSEHLRLTTALNRAPPRLRAVLDAACQLVILLLVSALLLPAWDHMAEEDFVVTPALGFPGSLRVAAIVAGLALMIAIALAQLLARAPDWRAFAAAAALVGAVCLGLGLAGPALQDAGHWRLLVFFVGVVSLCMLAGVPIAFAFGAAVVGYLATTTTVPLSVVIVRMDGGMSNQLLLSVPLFVFLGLMIEMTGMARAMVAFLAALVGHVRGGLSYVLLGAMYLVSGISGAKAADMAAVAPVLFPEMRQRGARDGELVALLAASGAMSETIPPSLVLITIGTVTGVSIAGLFAGGLLPALILALLLCVVARLRSRADDASAARRAGPRAVLRSLAVALPALALPFIIRTAVVEGVATATEVSTIGVLYAAVAGLLVYRQFPWRRLYPMLVQTACLSGAVLLIVGMASAMSWGLTQSGFSRQLASVMAGLPGGGPAFMALSILVFIVLGSVLEGIPAVVLLGPLLFPIARNLGIHEVHYAIVAVLAMGVGLFMPPFGIGYYTACAIGRVDPDEGVGPIFPYLGALLAGIVLIAAVPWFSTGFLPQ